MNQPGFSESCFNIASVAALLQIAFRIIIPYLQVIGIRTLISVPGHCGKDRILRISFKWAKRTFRSGHRDTVIIARSAFCAHQIIPAIPPCQMRRFKTAAVSPAAPDSPGQAFDCFLHGVILCNADLSRFVIPVTRLPFQGDQPFFPVVVMEKRGVKAR